MGFHSLTRRDPLKQLMSRKIMADGPVHTGQYLVSSIHKTTTTRATFRICVENKIKIENTFWDLDLGKNELSWDWIYVKLRIFIMFSGKMCKCQMSLCFWKNQKSGDRCQLYWYYLTASRFSWKLWSCLLTLNLNKNLTLLINR